MGKSSQYIITEEDLFCLSDYIEAALRGDESKAILRQLLDQQFGVIRSHPYQSEREKVLEHIPEILVCQSLPNEHGFCGENDCFCKELHRVESGDICKWMQKLRQAGE